MTATTTSAVPVSGFPRGFGIVFVILVAAVVGLTVGAIVQQTGIGSDRASNVAYWPDEPLAQHTPSRFRTGWPDEPLAQHTPHLFGSDAIDPSVLATEEYGRQRILRMMEQQGGAYGSSKEDEVQARPLRPEPN